MIRFVAIWAGQLISLLGSALTAFGLAVHIYRSTGDTADLAVLGIAAYAPQILVGPYGGVLADRHDRRRLMLAGDAGAALATAALLACAAAGRLETWSAALLVALAAACQAVQWPAWEAAIVELVPVPQLARANGLVELARGITQLVAPLAAGVLFGRVGLGGLIAIDLATFAVGAIPLLALRLPPRRAGAHPPRGWLADLAAAWRFVAARAGLVAMLLLFAATALTFGVAELLLRPLVLASAAPWALGLVLSMIGGGIIAGAVAVAALGTPARKIASIWWLQLVEGLALVAAGLAPSLAALCAAGFVYGAVIPPTFACARFVWQVKVPIDLQGRVSALRNVTLLCAVPIGYALAPPLATRLGTAPAIAAMGAVTAAAAAVAYAFAPYRRLERALPDAAAIREP
ncbi:MAG TPA: MFS transporter [Kofleriaceae bacterium]|nr:MFS transporter [Kofleriaceae bacterium]